jgi:multicomponent Na+:H+ antiporter subunit B
MIDRHDSVMVQTFVRVVLPPAQVFALYVLFHGHYSPGGGFQAGVLLGATYVLVGLSLGREALDRRLNEPICAAVAALGVLLYLGTGLVGLVAGEAFLDYRALPLGASPVGARYFGILLIETGVAIAVAATLVLIFSRLADVEREEA